jgi:F0F1-type ATP synthase membrane subunit b/b'
MIALASLSDVTTGIVEKFGVDTPLLIAQAINFVIVAFVIWQFALKKILLTIDEREKKIADSLKTQKRSNWNWKPLKSNRMKLYKKLHWRPKKLLPQHRNKQSPT